MPPEGPVKAFKIYLWYWEIVSQETSLSMFADLTVSTWEINQLTRPQYAADNTGENRGDGHQGRQWAQAGNTRSLPSFAFSVYVLLHSSAWSR